MKIYEIQNRTDVLIDQLYWVWKHSVKATHLFLSDQEIENIAELIPTYLNKTTHLIVAENELNEPVAFMGIDDKKLEMLFIDPNERGKGLGKELINYGIAHYDINELGVNEQNEQATAFYKHMGFQTYNRSETDEQGNPYPILYMKKSK
ncbi:acetyltransferase [Breznakia pachnodae]|uniref:Acetyltransferase n=1 Tax=Breznakia pachnodae TaxID=265178 RepID=A0ABU0E807_9FIRM|nr:acetyltransferase [Breznakia pachnodae]MDQ0362630.1 putative acetyltransferase [Breznakia pachnodae]